MDPLDELRTALAGEAADDATWQVLADALIDAGHPEGRLLTLVRQMLDPERPDQAIEAAAAFVDPRWLVEVVHRCWAAGDVARVAAGGRKLGFELSASQQIDLDAWLGRINGRKQHGRVPVSLLLATAVQALDHEDGVSWGCHPPPGEGYWVRCGIVVAVRVHDALVVGAGHSPGQWPPGVPGWNDLQLVDGQLDPEVARRWARREEEDRLWLTRLPTVRGTMDLDPTTVAAWVERRRQIQGPPPSELAAIPDTALRFVGEAEDVATMRMDFWQHDDTMRRSPGWDERCAEARHLHVVCAGVQGAQSFVDRVEQGAFPNVKSLQIRFGWPEPRALALVAACRLATRVESLVLHRGGFPDGSDFRALVEAFTSVRELELNRQHFQTDGIPDLGAMSSLSGLRLTDDWSVGDVRALLASVTAPLRSLSLRGPMMARPEDVLAMLEPVAALRSLAALHLPHQASTPATLRRIVARFSTLQVLELCDETGALAHQGGEALDPGAIEAIGTGLPGLRALDLSGQLVGDRGIEWLVRAMPPLVTLRLARCGIGDRGLTTLVRSPLIESVRRLDLAGNPLRGQAVKELVRSPRDIRLLDLSLARCKVGMAGARALAAWSRLVSLRVLDVSGTGMGRQGAQLLGRSPHFRVLHHRGLPSDFRSRNP